MPLRPLLRIGAVIRPSAAALFLIGLSACATLGSKEQEDLRAFDACSGTSHLRENVEVAMRHQRLSLPDAVLGLELVAPLRSGHSITLPRPEANFLNRAGLLVQNY